MDVITHPSTTRRTLGAPHDVVQRVVYTTPIMHVDACVTIVTNEPLFGGRAHIRFGDRQKQGSFCRRLQGRIHAVPRNEYGPVPRLILESIMNGAHRY
jgi:hypothetical protein